jgi:hypothetical protein
MSDEQPTRMSGTESSAGEKPRVTRYVLGISLVLVVVLFAGVLLAFR